jgi:hypothetical protein
MSLDPAAEIVPRLPRYVRFRDLRQAGICDNWEQLSNMIEDYGFPPGILLSPNVRAWDIEDVQHWLANRPTERKKVAPRKQNAELESA